MIYKNQILKEDANSEKKIIDIPIHLNVYLYHNGMYIIL